MNDELKCVLRSIPEELDWLIRDLVSELADEKFSHLRHGDRSTRNRGCTGPMCKKALRDAVAQRIRTVNALRGRTTRPHARSMAYVLADPFICRVKATHDKEFTQRSQKPAELQTAGRRVA